jgi:peptidoglycan/LPS O-acetylase OafA/YrhL
MAIPATDAAQIPPRTRLEYLDGLRAVAAIFVVMHHCWLQVWQLGTPNVPAGLTKKLTAIFIQGHFAVTVFIVLSGFCLMLPVALAGGRLRGTARQFFARRARRILPPYYAALGFSLLLIWLCIGHKTGTHWDISIPVHRSELLANLLLLQEMFGHSKINHAFWSIGVEWHIYFLFPFLVVLMRRVGAGRVAIVTTFLVLLIDHLVRSTVLVEEHLPYLGFFALGMLAAATAFSPGALAGAQRTWIPWLTGAFVLALVAATPVWTRHWQHLPSKINLYDLLVSIATSYLLIVMARTSRNRLREILEWRPLAFIGGFSFSLYLIHAPLLQVFWQYVVWPLHLTGGRAFLLMILVGLPLVTGVAYLFFLCCERPFMTRRTLPDAAK